MHAMIAKLGSRVDPVHALLVLALAAGLALRLYGIHWGLPDASHPLHSYHPDEALHLFAAEWLASGTIFPKHFMYGGTFYFALLNAFSHIAEMLQNVLGGGNLLADTILLGRYVLVGVALITIVLTYHVGRLLFDRSVGALAALFLAIAPAHVVWAQRLRPDEIATFLTVVILYLSVKILQSKPDNLRYCAYVGLVLGAAISLRFPSGVFASVPLAALLLACNEMSTIRCLLHSLFNRKTAVMGLCASAAYVLASPQILMYPEIFIAGLEVQWGYQSSPFPDAVGMGPGFYQYGWLMLHQALGYALYGLALLGVLYASFKRTAADWLLLAAIVPYLVLTSFTSWVVVRYTLPLVPLLVVLAARVAHLGLSLRLPHRVAGYAMIALVVGWTLLGDAAYLRLEAGKNVRELATEWIDQHVPHGSSIVAVKTYLEDDFFNPVIPKHYAYHNFPLVERGDGARLFREQRYDYLILHEYLYKNMERLGSRHPSAQARAFHQALLVSRYRLIKEFKQPVTFFGIDFSNSFSSNDYTIVNPGIRVYQYQ
jgi:hypothetical protein